jgi:hypothetical protein
MMFLSKFTLHLWPQVNSRYLKQQIILTSGTTSLFSLSPCPTLEVMLLRNGGHLKQNILLLPTSARRDRKIFNLYIQRWRPSTLIFVSRSFCSPIYWFTFSLVADSKALHLERSRTKAILKGLSMYIHYQRDYWLKHDRGSQSKKLLHYFKKAP